MPVDDGCLTELDAWLQKDFETWAVRCALDLIALGDYHDAINAAREQCIEDSVLGVWTSQDEIDECVNSTAEVIDTLNDYLDLSTDCDIAMDELQAAIDELEACRHAMESGAPVI